MNSPMGIDPNCYLVRQGFNDYTYFLSRMNLYGEWLWYVTLKPFEPRPWTEYEPMCRGYETTDAAMTALSRYLDPEQPVLQMEIAGEGRVPEEEEDPSATRPEDLTPGVRDFDCGLCGKPVKPRRNGKKADGWHWHHRCWLSFLKS